MNETLAVGLEVVGFSAAHLLPKDLISDTCRPRIRTALCGAQRLFAALCQSELECVANGAEKTKVSSSTMMMMTA